MKLPRTQLEQLSRRRHSFDNVSHSKVNRTLKEPQVSHHSHQVISSSAIQTGCLLSLIGAKVACQGSLKISLVAFHELLADLERLILVHFRANILIEDGIHSS